MIVCAMNLDCYCTYQQSSYFNYLTKSNIWNLISAVSFSASAASSKTSLPSIHMRRSSSAQSQRSSESDGSPVPVEPHLLRRSSTNSDTSPYQVPELRAGRAADSSHEGRRSSTGPSLKRQQSNISAMSAQTAVSEGAEAVAVDTSNVVTLPGLLSALRLTGLRRLAVSRFQPQSEETKPAQLPSTPESTAQQKNSRRRKSSIKSTSSASSDSAKPG